MKKILLLMCMLIPLNSLPAENPFKVNFEMILNPDFIMTFKDGTCYLLQFTATGRITAKFTESDLYWDKNGYGYATLFGQKYIVVYGAGENIIFFNTAVLSTCIDGSLWLDTTAKPRLKKITGSSYLTETIGGKKITYTPENLLNSLDADWFRYRNEVPPWVEGKPDSGIGEYVDVEFKQAQDTIAILNGYLDFKRLYLYKANNRIKRLRVLSLEQATPFDFEIEIEDKMKFHEIKLPKRVSKIRLEIKEVYCGSKYNDTALSGIFPVWDSNILIKDFPIKSFPELFTLE